MTRLFLFFVLCGGCNELDRPLVLLPPPAADGGGADGAELDGGSGPAPICKLDLVQPFAGTWSIDAAGFHGAFQCGSPGDTSSTASMLFRCPDGSACLLSVTPGVAPEAAFVASGQRCDAWTGAAELARTASNWSVSFDLMGCGERLTGVLSGSPQ